MNKPDQTEGWARVIRDLPRTPQPAVAQELPPSGSDQRLVLPWRAGLADNPQQNDKRFATYDAALDAAREQCNDLEVWAVWNEDDDVTALVHLNSIWRK